MSRCVLCLRSMRFVSLVLLSILFLAGWQVAAARAPGKASPATTGVTTQVTGTLQSIAITPATVTLAVGKTQQYTAMGTYNNNTVVNITSSVTWSSAKTSAVTVSAAGLATDVAASTSPVAITAHSGTVTSNSSEVSSPAATLTSIAITPATVTLALGKTQQYTATGTYSNGTTQNLTSSVTWKSATPAVVSVSSAGLATDVTASASTVAITATSGSVTSNTSTVTPAPALTTLAITPASVTLPLSGTQQYVATGTYSNKTTATLTSSVTWKSAAPTVVSVSSGGLATDLAASASTVAITATSGSITSNTSTVTPAAALTSIAITPATVTLPLNGTQQYVATGTYSNKTTANITSSVAWKSATPAVVSVSSAGLATDVAASASTVGITASLSGVTSNTSTVTPPPALTSIAITPASVSLALNGTQQYAATGTYSNGTTANLTSSVTWKSATPSVVSVSTAGLAKLLANTTTPVAVTASLGSVTSNSSSVTEPSTLTSIAITPASVSLGLGATEQYLATGTYSNGATQNITSAVTWVSGSPSLVSISAGGLATVDGTSSSAIAISATSGTVTSNYSWLSALSSLPRVCSNPTIDMKVLVVSDGQTEADFPAITQILNYLGTPYTVLDYSKETTGITPTLLSDGQCHGYYQGVIFASGGYIYTVPGMSTLTSYEQTFKIRQVNWFTYPGSDFGYNTATSTIPSTSTYSGSYTAAANGVFPYLNSATPLAIASAAVYLATPITAPSGTTITPLITDASGNALSLIYNLGDGRQYLTQTFDSNQYLTHDLLLAYGLVNWVTQGVFLGQYHVYAAAQVDDFFINDSEWIPGTPCTDPITKDRTPPDASFLPVFRLTSTDMTSLVTWQNKVETDPLLKTFKLTLAFNGVGTTGNTDWTGLTKSGAANDTLVTALPQYQQYFHWITHTYDHPGTLDGLHKSDVLGDPDTPQMDDIDLEILTNQYVANGTGKNVDTDSSDTVAILGLTDFNAGNAVTPGVTGLNDPNVPTYLYQDGIRYVVSDTSVANTTNPPNNNGANPSPNVGIVNSYEPGIYEVPRHPNDIFYNAANWNDDQAEFSCIYNNPVVTPYNTYTGPQILDYVSSSFVTNMLMGDMDPQMFHQPDLHDYDGLGDSLISDTYNMTFKKYEALYNLPVESLTLDQLGVGMQARNAYNLSGVTASLVGPFGSGQQITLTMPSTATVPSASIPVTGVTSSGSEVYGSQNISHIALTAGQTVTLPVQ